MRLAGSLDRPASSRPAFMAEVNILYLAMSMRGGAGPRELEKGIVGLYLRRPR
jgi:hypothetical protein